MKSTLSTSLQIALRIRCKIFKYRDSRRCVSIYLIFYEKFAENFVFNESFSEKFWRLKNNIFRCVICVCDNKIICFIFYEIFFKKLVFNEDFQKMFIEN